MRDGRESRRRQPQALLAGDDTLYAAAHDGNVTGICRSAEGARWELRYRDGE